MQGYEISSQIAGAVETYCHKAQAPHVRHTHLYVKHFEGNRRHE